MAVTGLMQDQTAVSSVPPFTTEVQSSHLVLLSLQQPGLAMLTGQLEGVIPLFQLQVTLLYIPAQ